MRTAEVKGKFAVDVEVNVVVAGEVEIVVFFVDEFCCADKGEVTVLGACSCSDGSVASIVLRTVVAFIIDRPKTIFGICLNSYYISGCFRVVDITIRLIVCRCIRRIIDVSDGSITVNIRAFLKNNTLVGVGRHSVNRNSFAVVGHHISIRSIQVVQQIPCKVISVCDIVIGLRLRKLR